MRYLYIMPICIMSSPAITQKCDPEAVARTQLRPVPCKGAAFLAMPAPSSACGVEYGAGLEALNLSCLSMMGIGRSKSKVCRIAKTLVYLHGHVSAHSRTKEPEHNDNLGMDGTA